MTLKIVFFIHFFVSGVLILSVLLQSGKGASIGSTFGGASSQTLFGSAGPATFLTKITAVCAFIFMVTSLYLTFTVGKRRTSSLMQSAPAITVPAKPAAEAPPVEKPAEAAPAEKKAPAARAEPAKKEAPAMKAPEKPAEPEPEKK